jgi:hypothetical protein
LTFVGFQSVANLNLLGTKGFGAVVVSVIIALYSPMCRKPLGVKQWGLQLQQWTSFFPSICIYFCRALWARETWMLTATFVDTKLLTRNIGSTIGYDMIHVNTILLCSLRFLSFPGW